MSKTDKTIPYKVRLLRDGVIKHNHVGGRECDFDKYDPAHPWYTHCGYRLNMSWSRQNKMFARRKGAADIETTLQRNNRHMVNRTLKDTGRDFDGVSFDKPLDSAYFID